MKNTIFITGGHVTPALATIDYFKKLPDIKLVYISRTQSDVHNSESIENKLIKELDIPIVQINPIKFHRHEPWRLLFDIKKFFTSLSQIRNIFDEFKPTAVLSFGGYVALPVSLIAYLKKVPIVTHEQTMILGLTNQIISKIASQTALSWPETQLAGPNTQLTGNPLRKSFFVNQKRPNWIAQSEKKIIYITGGSQGSMVINDYIFEILPKLTNKFLIIHQTGSARDQADFKKAIESQKKLPKSQQNNYIPKTNLTSDEVAFMLKNANLVISRSGANTITELLINKTKSILIPLPKSGRSEQLLNAQFLEKCGISKVLLQKDLQSLENLIENFIDDKLKIKEEWEMLAKLHYSAAESLGRLVIKCATKQKNFQ